MSKADDPKYATTNGLVSGCENSSAPGPIDPATGQYESYWVLSAEERAKGFVRPVRKAYRHEKCGCVTSMGPALCETYARDPKFYTLTFCCQCRTHFPVDQFVWEGTTEKVGS